VPAAAEEVLETEEGEQGTPSHCGLSWTKDLGGTGGGGGFAVGRLMQILPAVYVKGRAEAVAMLDLMMADPDFMRFQDEIMADFEAEMMQEIEMVGGSTSSLWGRGGWGWLQGTSCHPGPGLRSAPLQGGRLRSASFAGGRRRQVTAEEVDVCDSEVLDERVEYLQEIESA
jgi:hypothetical protein